MSDNGKNQHIEELEELEDDHLGAVAGGAKTQAVNPYAGYASNLSEGVSPGVVREVERIARECMAAGEDRRDCSSYIQSQKYYELCCMNEAEGYDYMIDFYYINLILDAIYGPGT